LANAGGQGGIAVQTSGPLIGVVNVNLPDGSIRPGTLSLSDLGRGAMRRFVRELTEEIVIQIRESRRLRGDVGL
jgi:hypothetical protein